MATDVWARPEACFAAAAVFRVAEEHPVLRFASSASAERVAAQLPGGAESVPRLAAEELIAATPESEVERLVGLAGRVAPGRWRALVEQVGAEYAREPLLAGVATSAITELLPPPRWLAAMRETTADGAPGPLNVLATLLHPESIWSLEEARGAQTLAVPDLGPAQRARIVLSFARAELEPWRVDRARLVASPVGRVLPLDEAPRTSRHLSQALGLVRRDRRAAVEFCELLLLSYVLRLDGSVPILPSRN